MSKFLLISLPICETHHRYYPAAYMAGIIKDAGWEFKYLDLNALIFQELAADDPIKLKWDAEFQLEVFNAVKDATRKVYLAAFEKWIVSWQPDLVGFSLMESNRHFVIDALRLLHDKFENKIPVMFGGPDCFPREYYLRYLAERCPPDIMLQGEAEVPLPKFLNEFEKTASVKTKIPGFVYHDEDGHLVDTGLPELSYLKKKPFAADYSIFDYTTINCPGDDQIFTFFSKGCINKCAFCSESRNYQPYRRREAAEVIDEIEQNIAQLPRGRGGKAKINFRDSIFNASPSFITEVCELIIKRKLDIEWFCLGAFRTEMSDELLDLMRQSGCVQIFFGFESASQRVIDLMGKNFGIDHCQKIIEKCLSRGINILLPVINGFPGEFTRDFLTTMGFVLRYRGRDHVTFGYSNACGIKNKTPLSEYPDDFFIGEVDETQYVLKDGSSTFLSRQLRQAINETLIHNQEISDNKTLGKMNFNDLSVAAELAHILFFICKYLYRDDEAAVILVPKMADKEENTEILLGRDFLQHIVPGLDLKNWFVCDKNNPDIKRRIITFLGGVIKDYEQKILSTENVSFREFRDSFYADFNDKSSAEIPSGLQLNNVCVSRNDKGKYVIYEGSVSAPPNGAKLTRIEARCGNYYFDVNYGVMPYYKGNTNQKSHLLSFWLKVKKIMLQSNKLRLKFYYQDRSSQECVLSPDIIINGGHQAETAQVNIKSFFRNFFHSGKYS